MFSNIEEPDDKLPKHLNSGGSRVDSAFHPSEVDKMSTRNLWDKLPPQSGCSLEAVEPHP